MSDSTDFIGARDIAFGLLQTEWDAACQAQFSRAYPVLYQGKVAAIPAADQFWLRLSLQTVTEKKAKTGSPNRWTAYGVIFAQMFFPLNVKGSWEDGLQLAKRLKNRLAQPSSSATVWFRNARQNELIPDDTHHRLNVVADCEYDEIV